MTAGSVAVIGAGTMGHGIAQVAAMAGHDVALTDAVPGVAEKGIDRIRSNLGGAVARSKITTQQRDETLDRIRLAHGVGDAAANAEFIIEAVPEDAGLKAAVFAEVDACAPADSVLASNTSSLSITALQDATARAGRVIGLHFFNPVHINALVEIVRGLRTDPQVVERSLDFVKGLGKDPIVVNDSPGFATSRLGVLLGLEAIRMLEQGVASADDIDKAMVLGYRHPMGPLRLTDLVGLDIRLAIAKYLHEQLGSEAFCPPHLLEDMVAQGKLGKKSGMGFYTWTADG
jgi:3-hydroxybutyryl-CoA dehydrogenase